MLEPALEGVAMHVDGTRKEAMPPPRARRV